QHVDRGLAALLATEREILALWRLHALERANLDALPGGKAGGGRRGRSVRFECGRDRRPVDQLLEIGLPLGDADDADGEAAGRAECFDRRFRRQPVLAQLGPDDVANLMRQPGKPAGWQLLAANFQQQLAIHQPASPAATAGAVASSAGGVVPST